MYDILVICHIVNFEFTGWVQIQNSQMTMCHIVNFFYLHPPSKFKIYNITNEKSYDRRGSALWMS